MLEEELPAELEVPLEEALEGSEGLLRFISKICIMSSSDRWRARSFNRLFFRHAAFNSLASLDLSNRSLFWSSLNSWILRLQSVVPSVMSEMVVCWPEALLEPSTEVELGFGMSLATPVATSKTGMVLQSGSPMAPNLPVRLGCLQVVWHGCEFALRWDSEHHVVLLCEMICFGKPKRKRWESHQLPQM